MIIRADLPDYRRLTTKQRQIVHDVSRAAQSLADIHDAGNRYGGFGRYAADFAEIIFVQHRVADNQDFARANPVRDKIFQLINHLQASNEIFAASKVFEMSSSL